jgi:hypothetical protein
MAEQHRVAPEGGGYAYDEDGFRRWVAPGDSIPDYWTWEEPAEEPKPATTARKKSK